MGSTSLLRRVFKQKHTIGYGDHKVMASIGYIEMALGPAWGNAQIEIPLEQRHPILLWYHKLCEYQRTFVKVPGKVHGAGMTGAVAAYMHLAYDLYALDHNAELQATGQCFSAGRSIITISEFSNNRSNTISLPSGVKSNVRIAAVLSN